MLNTKQKTSARSVSLIPACAKVCTRRTSNIPSLTASGVLSWRESEVRRLVAETPVFALFVSDASPASVSVYVRVCVSVRACVCAGASSPPLTATL